MAKTKKIPNPEIQDAEDNSKSHSSVSKSPGKDQDTDGENSFAHKTPNLSWGHHYEGERGGKGRLGRYKPESAANKNRLTRDDVPNGRQGGEE